MIEHETAQIGQKALILRNGKCLVLEGAAQPGTWDLPGGRINQGENPETALHRELQEELGIKKCTVGETFFYDLWYRPNKTTICLVASFVDIDREDFLMSHEHLQYAWITKEELKNYEFFTPIMSTMIQRAFEYHESKNNGN
ncbi:MAG: hypothetical protein A3B30_00475 [Candidatus Komeilibacteria bacterium RIFCSPLOWO2_01_FULL_52_15]|uniref:8-oxo-dGTP diphosphatase n=2 Tax=Candidatus Komeiliibacteriota TaxID=1817908 RepID=A0A1G2BPN2_9BACT|nr:MAG: hypothetical protein A2677_02945 [Candidatus Komeilibacteria bacterium RIFCSPHIGHO2_01_FULL_52_14]OGY90320.1 MAG: hypothetical protein A3B30_00475 [Candidatus Komeilibacteria bacterium RIFCSPLOWO2_01_FULL_52_15]